MLSVLKSWGKMKTYINKFRDLFENLLKGLIAKVKVTNLYLIKATIRFLKQTNTTEAVFIFKGK